MAEPTGVDLLERDHWRAAEVAAGALRALHPVILRAIREAHEEAGGLLRRRT